VVEFKVKSPERVALVDITADVNRALAEIGTREGKAWLECGTAIRGTALGQRSSF